MRIKILYALIKRIIDSRFELNEANVLITMIIVSILADSAINLIWKIPEGNFYRFRSGKHSLSGNCETIFAPKFISQLNLFCKYFKRQRKKSQSSSLT